VQELPQIAVLLLRLLLVQIPALLAPLEILLMVGAVTQRSSAQP
jgi:hypothetical protein